MEQFLENTKDLEVTTVARAQEALDKKETATFFIGRKTCPYCRKFAGTLAGVVAETKAHIYFINSEEPSQLFYVRTRNQRICRIVKNHSSSGFCIV